MTNSPTNDSSGLRTKLSFVTVIGMLGLIVGLGLIRYSYYTVVYSSGLSAQGRLLPIAIVFLAIPLVCGFYLIAKKYFFRGIILLMMACTLPFAYRFWLELALVSDAKMGKVEMFGQVGPPIGK